ncbi:MAG TPA: polysaccharide deacetylase family protein [Syntrophomonas sp.]|nr:polysaccharide deacetylase family protein [Syntrophomonas sp.]
MKSRVVVSMIVIIIISLLPLACTSRQSPAKKEYPWPATDQYPAPKTKGATGKTIYYQNQAVVLLYHDIDGRECGTAIRRQRFFSHLRMLEESGFAIISLEDIVAFIEQGKSLPANAVAITLDDGCVSNYAEVWPALQSRHWPFSVFVTTSEMGKIRTNGLRRVNWAELKKMSAAGVLVGSHSDNGHKTRKTMDGSQTYWLTDHFAPPYGASNSSLEKLALQAGYKYIWTTKRLSIQRSSSPTSLGRVSVGIKGTSAAQVKATILKVAKNAE